MKLIPDGLMPHTSHLIADGDEDTLAIGDTTTLEHLLQCRAYLKLLVATARQPEHFGILDKAKTMMNGFKETAAPATVERVVPLDEPLQPSMDEGDMAARVNSDTKPLPSICPHCGRDNTGYPDCTSEDCPGNKGIT